MNQRIILNIANAAADYTRLLTLPEDSTAHPSWRAFVALDLRAARIHAGPDTRPLSRTWTDWRKRTNHA